MLPFQTRFLMSLLENFDLKGFVKSVSGYLITPHNFLQIDKNKCEVLIANVVNFSETQL